MVVVNAPCHRSLPLFVVAVGAVCVGPCCLVLFVDSVWCCHALALSVFAVCCDLLLMCVIVNGCCLLLSAVNTRCLFGGGVARCLPLFAVRCCVLFDVDLCFWCLLMLRM